jgi:hypothetical protein
MPTSAVTALSATVTPCDRATKRSALTDKGRALKAQAEPIPHRLADAMHLEPAQAVALKEGLEALLA